MSHENDKGSVRFFAGGESRNVAAGNVVLRVTVDMQPHGQLLFVGCLWVAG